MSRTQPVNIIEVTLTGTNLKHLIENAVEIGRSKAQAHLIVK